MIFAKYACNDEISVYNISTCTRKHAVPVIPRLNDQVHEIHT